MIGPRYQRSTIIRMLKLHYPAIIVPMRANFMLLAQYAGQILNGGPVISNVFRLHHVPSFPAPFEAYVALELEIDPHEIGRHELLLRIIDEDGIPLREIG